MIGEGRSRAPARFRALLAIVALALASAGCARAPGPATNDPNAPCASLAGAECVRARGLVAAASTYADAPHAYLLASADLAPGRGIARGPTGDRRGARACATVVAGTSRATIDASAVDYGFVGVAIDATLVSADADVAPLLAGGDHVIRLVALALVRDRARAAVTAGPSLASRPDACGCGEATHVVGEARWGALVSYDTPAPSVRHATKAIDVVRAALADRHARVHVTRAGSLFVDGLAPYLAGRATRPVAFRVADAVPVAYALRPLVEACPGAFPAPDVTPSPVDFGVAPYGTEATRAVRVVNRAGFDLDAVLGARTFRVPARGEIDLPLTWTPDGDAWSCETQTRDEAIRFVPTDRTRTPLPAEQIARVLESVRTGRPTLAHTEPIEPAARRGDPTERDWACPADFVPTTCRIDHPTCGAPGALVAPVTSAAPASSTATPATAPASACADVRAETRPNGCHFSCRAKNGGICRFEAVQECRLRCPD